MRPGADPATVHRAGPDATASASGPDPAPAATALPDEDYQRFAAALEHLSGIQLGPNKGYLVVNRLSTLVPRFGFDGLPSLIRQLDDTPRAALVSAVIDAMTTNETKWFRDDYPFRALKELILPAWQSDSRRTRRILSAACSSGQEAYSIAMVVAEHAHRQPADAVPEVEILATDISSTALARARAARFADGELERGLDPARRARYFEADGSGGRVLKPEIRSRVSFRQRNLLDDLGALGRFDVVFCRNVLIYFSPERKRRVLANLLGVLEPGAYLMVGGSESLSELPDRFEMKPFGDGVIYRLRR